MKTQSNLTVKSALLSLLTAFSFYIGYLCAIHTSVDFFHDRVFIIGHESLLRV